MLSNALLPVLCGAPVRQECSFTMSELSRKNRGLTFVAMDLELLGKLVAVIMRARRAKCVVTYNERVVTQEQQLDLIVAWMYIRAHGLHRTVIEGGITEVMESPVRVDPQVAMYAKKEEDHGLHMVGVWMMLFVLMCIWHISTLFMLAIAGTIVATLRYGVVTLVANTSSPHAQPETQTQSNVWHWVVIVLVAFVTWRLTRADMWTLFASIPFVMLFFANALAFLGDTVFESALVRTYKKMREWIRGRRFPRVSISFRFPSREVA